MTAFLEKVARGIIRAELGSRYPSLGTEDDVHVTQADMVRARAAVEAMREPDDGMVDAGEQIAVQPFVPASQFTTLTWQAMVDAALSGQQP